MECVIGIDAGTTGITVMAFDRETNILCKRYSEFKQIYPKQGWVEHDPLEIISVVRRLLDEVIELVGKENVKSIGITNQRETTVVWDKSGKPVYNAIVWQCRRTAEICEELKKTGINFKEKCGLVVDAYFSGTKLKWILDNVKCENVLFGTIDTWILWNLCGVHVTDVSNASRTLMYNINTLEWDDEILNVLGVSKEMLPAVKSSSEVYGHFNGIPVSGIAGDQQAALFGQCCFSEGDVKNTFGTGCFILMNTGERKVNSDDLLTTIGWKIGDEVVYALEGSVFVSGAAVQWLRDGLGLIKDASETEKMALSVENNGGVVFVPALAGLGAPYWDMYARGTMIGMTRGTKKEHIVRSVLESVAYQNKDVVDLMVRDSEIGMKEMKVDGGMVVNSFLMQFQADMLNCRIDVASVSETTCLGAAFLSGLAVGFWSSRDEIKGRWKSSRKYGSMMDEGEREFLYSMWKKAVSKSRNWTKHI